MVGLSVDGVTQIVTDDFPRNLRKGYALGEETVRFWGVIYIQI